MAQVHKKIRILGQDPDILCALWANIVSWVVATFFPQYLRYLLPKYPEQEDENKADLEQTLTKCISIGRPGGLEQLQKIRLKRGIVTVGYNVKDFCPPPFTPPIQKIPGDCVILANHYFSVNYADVTIRWGLYESAKRFVGWPIVPGFDVAGTIEVLGDEINNQRADIQQLKYKVGDRVFGCTLFGAYSSKILIPKIQLRKIPEHLSTAQAASLPTVSLTALYALHLAGGYPTGVIKYRNKSVLIHSAAGGVGSMLVQMSKLLGFGPIVGVVGSSRKVTYAKSLGCDYVIDKSMQPLFPKAKQLVPEGFAAAFDANGVSTLKNSYDSLAPTGRLIVYGFHTNLPLGQTTLSPLEWIRMGAKQSRMPKFDPMDMTVSNKSVLAFNLSFFAEEVDLVSNLFDQIINWLEHDQLKYPPILEMDLGSVAQAHQHMQSGKSIGKVVICTGVK